MDKNTDDPWYLITNDKVQDDVLYYSHHYKNKLDIKFCRYTKNNKCHRILSNFKLGLTIVQSVLNDEENYLNFKIKTDFKIFA